MEQNLFEPGTGYATEEDVLLKQKCSPISAPTNVPEKDCSLFECNICLDSAQEPMVTPCGHLYCWPCIYQWLYIQASRRDANGQQQTCPLCKTSISSASLVPLYGHGETSSESDSKKPNLGVVIPSRPHPVLNTSVSSSNTSTRHQTQRLHSDFFQSRVPAIHNPQYLPHHYGSHAALASSSLGGMATISFFNPLMGVRGGMTLDRVFGGSTTSLFTYPSQSLLMSNNPRIRRQEMELERSLYRVSFFLFCCLILCLLLF